jgi:apolipoprotein D and lipocalin family protein
VNKKTLLIGGAILSLASLVLLKSCKTIPGGATAVKPFDVNKYMGKWYEIARLDFKYERDLNNTTATYSLNDDGTMKVINRGFNVKTKQRAEATGKAKFIGSPEEAKLQVSFFGPFYSGYNVVALDPEYKYALVAGESLKYLWLLSRETNIPDSIREEYLKKAEQIGYGTSDLIWVEHNDEL